MSTKTVTLAVTLSLMAGLVQMQSAMAFNPQPDPPGKGLQKQSVHPEFDVFLPNGQKQRAFRRGNQLILIGLRGGNAPAPDGTYRRADGSSILVQKGIIVVGGRSHRPGETRMLNPQPLPPKSQPAGAQNPAASKSLNPQPLPPKQGSSLPAVQ